MPDLPPEFTAAEKEALLSEAIDNWGARIVKYLTSLCRDRELAKDIAQKLWIYVYQAFNPWDYGHIGYLERKARNLWIDDLRHKGRRPEVDFVDQTPEQGTLSEAPEPQTAEREEQLFADFWDHFHGTELTEQQKQIFWWHERYGFTMQEVAEKLSIAKSTAHDHLKLVKSRCLNYLNQN